MIMEYKRFYYWLFLIFFSVSICNGQELRVTLSPDAHKVNRNANDGISTIIFDSKVKGLVINNGTDDQWTKPNDNLFVFFVDTKRDILRGYELSQRAFVLNSPKSTEYLLEVDEILPNQVFYYTVILPDQYPALLSVEYLFSKTTQYGLRLSFGKRIGGYVSYKWGEYKTTGENIDNITDDCDITQANKLGGIRTSITAGLRLGLFQKQFGTTLSALYLLVGGGYGEYGRQWNNQHLVGNSTYFYSDYIKGFDGETAIQCTLFDWFCFSIGADMVIGNGKISTDYQIGVGINLNINKLFKSKKIIR